MAQEAWLFLEWAAKLGFFPVVLVLKVAESQTDSNIGVWVKPLGKVSETGSVQQAWILSVEIQTEPCVKL